MYYNTSRWHSHFDHWPAAKRRPVLKVLTPTITRRSSSHESGAANALPTHGDVSVWVNTLNRSRCYKSTLSQSLLPGDLLGRAGMTSIFINFCPLAFYQVSGHVGVLWPVHRWVPTGPISIRFIRLIPRPEVCLIRGWHQPMMGTRGHVCASVNSIFTTAKGGMVRGILYSSFCLTF